MFQGGCYILETGTIGQKCFMQIKFGCNLVSGFGNVCNDNDDDKQLVFLELR